MKQPINEVKRFQELAGIKKEQLDENAFKKGAAALGLAAALAGSPKVGMAQTKPTRAPQTAIDSAFSISNLPDNKAGEELVYSYRDNPMSASEWAQGSEENKALLRSIKKVFNAARLGADYQSNEQGMLEAMVEELGKNYKKTATAAEFMSRDQQDLTAQLR